MAKTIQQEMEDFVKKISKYPAIEQKEFWINLREYYDQLAIAEQQKAQGTVEEWQEFREKLNGGNL